MVRKKTYPKGSFRFLLFDAKSWKSISDSKQIFRSNVLDGPFLNDLFKNSNMKNIGLYSDVVTGRYCWSYLV